MRKSRRQQIYYKLAHKLEIIRKRIAVLARVPQRYIDMARFAGNTEQVHYKCGMTFEVGLVQ